MEEKDMKLIPFVVLEDNMVRMDRIIKRLWVLCILLVLMLVGTNAAWIYYESQWQVIESTEEVTQDAQWDSGDVVLNGTGEVNYYGPSASDSKEND